MGSGEQQISKAKQIKSSYKIVRGIFMLEVKSSQFSFNLLQTDTCLNICRGVSVKFVVGGAIACVLFNLHSVQCPSYSVHCTVVHYTLYTDCWCTLYSDQ